MIQKIITVITYYYKYFLKKLKVKSSSKELFDGDDALFKKILLKDTRVYAEYGCGDSSIWVTNETDVRKVYSVDTSMEWVKNVENLIKKKEGGDIKFIDCGSVGEWGRPVDYSERNNFINYTDWIWQQKDKPDTVLIDGRFRVCCFLTCLKNANPGTKIIFDDYIFRSYYHIVEEFVNRAEVNRRQCLFIVPDKSEINMDSINSEIKNFRYVME